MKRFLAFLFLISSIALSQDDERNYFPINDGTIQRYYFINHQNFVTSEVSSIEDSAYTLIEKIYLGTSNPLENISRYKFIQNEFRILTVDTIIKLPDYKPLNVPGIVMKFPIEIGKKWEFEYGRIKYKRELVKKHREIILEDKSYQDVLEIKQIAYDINDVRTSYEFYGYGIGLIKTEGLIKNTRIPILILAGASIKPDSLSLSSGNERLPNFSPRINEIKEDENELMKREAGEEKELITKTPEQSSEEEKKKNVPAPEQP
jgi:hypothetical protein